MLFNRTSLAALAILSSSFLSATASPVTSLDINKRQAASTTTPTSTRPTAALIVTTDKDGKPTTLEAALPSVLQGSATTSGDAASPTTPTSTTSSRTFSATGASKTLIPSKDFPVCTDAAAKPFCLPTENQDVYVGSTYYVTWNADFFAPNSTITVKLNYDNATHIQAWSSENIDAAWGVTTVQMEKDWLQGYSMYNLSFYALVYEGGSSKATAYDGPNIQLKNEPPRHYEPPAHTKMPDKESLIIGLPVGLGALVLVLVGLYFGMRKHRKIGLGNVMGRRKGYSSGKSRRQRLGLGSKKGAIRLQEREIHNLPPDQMYRDQPEDAITPAPPRRFGHSRDESLGSLVSEGERPTGNAFRSEIDRQRTGGRF